MLILLCTTRKIRSFRWNAATILFHQSNRELTRRYSDPCSTHSFSNKLGLCIPRLWISGGGRNSTDFKDDASFHDGTVNVPENATQDLPRREFGYRAIPFSWDELVQIIVHHNELSRLSRSVEVERSYSRRRTAVLEQYETLYDHILFTKFGLERHLDETTGKWTVDMPSPGTKGFNQTVLVKNDYPYFVEPDIEHWVLWKLNSEISVEDTKEALETLRQMKDKGDVIDIIWWENPPRLKSLPDINHIHILVRRITNE